MILTKILLDFWDSPENILFQKNNFYILFHDIFKKGWFIICFVSTFGIYRDFKWKWIKIEESPHIPWVFNQFFRKVRFLKVIQLNPSQIQVNQKIIKEGAQGARKKCSSINRVCRHWIALYDVNSQKISYTDLMTRLDSPCYIQKSS